MNELIELLPEVWRYFFTGLALGISGTVFFFKWLYKSVREEYNITSDRNIELQNALLIRDKEIQDLKTKLDSYNIYTVSCEYFPPADKRNQITVTTKDNEILRTSCGACDKKHNCLRPRNLGNECFIYQ